MELVTKSKRKGMNCSIDVFYEQSEGFSKHLNDKTCYKIILINSGSFVVEDNGKYLAISTPAAILINEKSDFNIISEEHVKCRTLFFRPTIIREEFTIEAINSHRYDKFLTSLKDTEPLDRQKVEQLVNGDIQFEDCFSNQMIYQDALYFVELFSTGRDIVYYSLTKQEYDTVLRHFLSIEYEINEQPDNFWILRTRFFIQSILFMATADFYRNFRQSDIYNDPLVARVTRYFWEHIDEDITLDSILKLFSINKNSLNDAFNKEVSMSCMAYLEQLRINSAKSELQYGKHTISEISVGVGYSDTNYFSKVFKKHTGLTPSEYLKQLRGLC